MPKCMVELGECKVLVTPPIVTVSSGCDEKMYQTFVAVLNLEAVGTFKHGVLHNVLRGYGHMSVVGYTHYHFLFSKEHILKLIPRFLSSGHTQRDEIKPVVTAILNNPDCQLLNIANNSKNNGYLSIFGRLLEFFEVLVDLLWFGWPKGDEQYWVERLSRVFPLQVDGLDALIREGRRELGRDMLLSLGLCVIICVIVKCVNLLKRKNSIRKEESVPIDCSGLKKRL